LVKSALKLVHENQFSRTHFCLVKSQPNKQLLSREEMLTAVRKGPWKRAVETLLSSKKQLLEDTTNKQILSSRWQLEERERKAFKKEMDQLLERRVQPRDAGRDQSENGSGSVGAGTRSGS
jgi:hypothetical protein